MMIHPATYQTVRAAIDRAFELFPIDLRGRTVLLKPNVLRASEADEAIATNPAVLKAVVEKVLESHPASLVVGDNPGLFSYGANEESFRRTGLLEASLGHYRNIGNDSRRVDFNPEFMSSVTVSTAVLDADVVISLPKFKTHGLTVLTGAIKNCYGYLPGAQKARLHRAAGTPGRFHELIVDVFRLRPPDLFIMDAVIGMEGNGPAGTDLREIGLILASDNAVTMDSIVAFMMGCDPEALPFLRKAQSLGLGSCDLGAVEIFGELKQIPDFKLPPLSGEIMLGNEAIQNLLTHKSRLSPKADRELCTGCGTCIEQCAMSALTMSADDIPVVDADTCISCFCCQEMCPEQAMQLQ